MSDAHLLITENIDIWTTAIKKRSATGRGSNKKIELTGIKKLRELILELAVRGKLVPQDPNDEPASVLLEKIAAEKELLIKDKKIKKTKVLPKIGENEKLFNIPEFWSWVRFGNIAQHNSGKTLDKGRNSGEPYSYLTTSNLYWGTFNLENVRQMLIESDQLEKCTAKKNDLLICEGGEAGRAAVWEKDEDICFQNHIHRARFYSEISPFFMFRFFEQLTATGEINNHRKGVGISNMSGKSLALIVTPLPPLEEQHRIVAKVDELMLLCDQLEQQTEDSITAHKTLVETLLATLSNSESSAAFKQNWARIAAHFDTLFTTEHSIDQLKQTVLQLAVMGKLVPQNPNDEPASVLLEKIAAEKEQLIKDKKIKKQKSLPAITEDKKPFALPDGWEWSNLNNLITIMDAGWSPACPPEASPSVEKWGVLKTTAVQSMEYRQYENKVLADNKDPKSQYEVKVGDILITRAGPKNRVGVSCLVERTRPKLMISDKIIRFHLVEVGMCERYISLCLNAGTTAEYLESAKSGMAESQMNISQDKLKSAPIPLCAVNEQHLIVKKVDELMTLCDQLKSRLSAAQITQLHLADTIVEQAVN